MGDRALVIFVSVDAFGNKGIRVSPTAYLHNYGSEVPEFIAKLKALMLPRRSNDESYGLARFIGIVHSTMPNDCYIGIVHSTIPNDCYNLGCFETEPHVKKAIEQLFTDDSLTSIRARVWDYDLPKPKQVYKQLLPYEILEDYSHSDAGVVVVDTRDYSWRAYGGYLSLTA